MLLREMMSDPFLESYGAIVIDQAHERTVSTDVLLGLLKDILVQRPDLRVVVLAVSPMTDKLLSHFGKIPSISLEVSSTAEVVHSISRTKDYFYSALRLVLEIHRTKEDGDVLVFFASSEVGDVFIYCMVSFKYHQVDQHCLRCLLQEVHCACRILRREGSRQGGELGRIVPTILCPTEGGSPSEMTKEEGFKRSRKVFLATPREEDVWWAAESVSFVIDTGVQKKTVSYHQQP